VSERLKYTASALLLLLREKVPERRREHIMALSGCGAEPDAKLIERACA